MSKAERLLQLLENLRRRKYAVSGRTLAEELEVSLRTVYRDIAALQAQGAPIEGEAGVGFILRPGYFLPPMIFTPEEIEAIVLGTKWVVKRGDKPLADAAHTALSKIKAVLPDPLKETLESGTLLVPIESHPRIEDELAASVRQSIREERIVELIYRDKKDRLTRRSVWPFALAYFEQSLIVTAWCELRKDFRHFRVDRIETWTATNRKYPDNRLSLLYQWQIKEGIVSSDKYEF